MDDKWSTTPKTENSSMDAFAPTEPKTNSPETLPATLHPSLLEECFAIKLPITTDANGQLVATPEMNELVSNGVNNLDKGSILSEDENDVNLEEVVGHEQKYKVVATMEKKMLKPGIEIICPIHDERNHSDTNHGGGRFLLPMSTGEHIACFFVLFAMVYGVYYLVRSDEMEHNQMTLAEQLGKIENVILGCLSRQNIEAVEKEDFFQFEVCSDDGGTYTKFMVDELLDTKTMAFLSEAQMRMKNGEPLPVINHVSGPRKDQEIDIRLIIRQLEYKAVLRRMVYDDTSQKINEIDVKEVVKTEGDVPPERAVPKLWELLKKVLVV